MWAASLITSGAAAFGRILIVNFLPSLVIVLGIFLPARAGAYAFVPAGEDPTLIFTLGDKVDSPGLLLLIATVVTLGTLIQMLQISLIRVLEGYWGDRGPLAGFGQGRSLHFAKQATEGFALYENRSAIQQRLIDLGLRTDLSLSEQVSMRRQLEKEMRAAASAASSRMDYPPDPRDSLPTKLGNVVRSFEMRAGERYGYSTIQTWPRLYPSIDDRLSRGLHGAVDAVDAGVNFTYAFAIAALSLLVAYLDTPGLLWIALVLAAFSVLSHRSAIAGARMQGLMEFVAYDLHRFDMVKALHLGLPADTQEESRLAGNISKFLRDGIEPDDFVGSFPRSRYDHPE